MNKRSVTKKITNDGRPNFTIMVADGPKKNVEKPKQYKTERAKKPVFQQHQRQRLRPAKDPTFVRTIQAFEGESVHMTKLICQPREKVVVRHRGGRLRIDKVVVCAGAKFFPNLDKQSTVGHFTLGPIRYEGEDDAQPPQQQQTDEETQYDELAEDKH